LIIPTEYLLIIFYKSIGIVGRSIWRVDKHKIPTSGIKQRFLKIACSNIGILEQLARFRKIVIWQDYLSFCAYRNIEFAPQIFSVQAIPTSSVEIQKLCGTGVRLQSNPITLRIVEALGV
tara:strand:- start:2404 stop:2763 length:360 start_codon:yes stop_codon:yes gene_type:complete